MARPERNDVDYFPHAVNHGRKMYYLRSKFKNDGYSVWFMLLEQLGKAKYHYLDLSDEIQVMYLSSEFMVSEILLKEIIEVLIRLGEFDAEIWADFSVLYNQKFVDNISDAYLKRSNNCIDKKSLLTLLLSKSIRKPSKSIRKPSNGTLKGVDNPHSIVKDSKVKEIIDHLNSTLGTKYRTNSDKTNSLIKARLKENFTLKDFKTVIEKKYSQWNNTEWEKFLRPETLFSPKFESYLNEKSPSTAKKKTGRSEALIYADKLEREYKPLTEKEIEELKIKKAKIFT